MGSALDLSAIFRQICEQEHVDADGTTGSEPTLSQGLSSVLTRTHVRSQDAAVSGVAVVPNPREPLLGPSSQRLEVALLGARTAAVLRRIIGGADLDDVDWGILEAAADMMTTAADAVQVVSDGGRLKRDRSSLGFGAMALTVELTARAVPPADLPKFLRELAEAIQQLRRNPDPAQAELILPSFSALADVATRTAGTVGEGGGSLI